MDLRTARLIALASNRAVETELRRDREGERMPLKDKDHPVWKIGTIAATALLVFAVNYLNASKFDGDDISRITQILMGLGVLHGARFVATKPKDD